MEKEDKKLPSQGSRIPQGAVGARDIVPVPDPSSSNDGQEEHERGRGLTTGTPLRRKRRLKSILIPSNEEEDREAENNRPDKANEVSPPVLSPERKRGTGCSVARRGRGRPPTTGEYVGLAAAKELLLSKEREEMELLAEKEMLEGWAITRRTRLANVVNPTEEEASPGATASHLCGTVEDSVEAILKVARTSGKLKGTYIKVLKEAASSIREAATSLKEMTVSEETKQLEREISRLSEEVRNLKKERDRERQEREEREKRSPIPPPRTNRRTSPVIEDGPMMEMGEQECAPVMPATPTENRQGEDVLLRSSR